jgi:hypothetical protein
VTPFEEQIAAMDRALAGGPGGFRREAGLAQAVWRGEWNGRSAVVRASADRRTRYAGEVRVRSVIGHRLRVEVATVVRTELLFVRQAFARSLLARAAYAIRRRTAISCRAPALAGFVAVTLDPAWTTSLLESPELAAVIAVLLTKDAQANFAGSVYFAPTSTGGKLFYASPRLPLEAVTAEAAHEALDRAAAIADGAERLPPPTVPVSFGPVARLAERAPWAFALLVLGGCMALLALGAILVIGLAFVIGSVMR